MRADPTLLQQPLEGRIQRAIINQEFILGLMLEKLRNPVSVVWSQLQAAQDQNFERALQKLEPLKSAVYRRHSIYILRNARPVNAVTLSVRASRFGSLPAV